MGHFFKDGEAKNKAGSWPSTLKDVNELQVFGFCLTAAQRKKVQEWVAEILAASGLMGPATRDEEAKPASKGAKRKQNNRDTEALVDNYFDN